MNRFTSIALVAFCNVSFLTGLGLASPCALTNLGLDLWNLPALGRELEGQHRITAQLDKQLGEVNQRLQVRCHIVDELVAGRLTLLQAARQFQEINRQTPEEAVLPHYFTHSTPDEMACKQVLIWVESYLSHRPALQSATLTRLQAELQEHLRHHATIRFTH